MDKFKMPKTRLVEYQFIIVASEISKRMIKNE